jgi:hypothetical protein
MDFFTTGDEWPFHSTSASQPQVNIPCSCEGLVSAISCRLFTNPLLDAPGESEGIQFFLESAAFRPFSSDLSNDVHRLGYRDGYTINQPETHRHGAAA